MQMGSPQSTCLWFRRSHFGLTAPLAKHWEERVVRILIGLSMQRELMPSGSTFDSTIRSLSTVFISQAGEHSDLPGIASTANILMIRGKTFQKRFTMRHMPFFAMRHFISRENAWLRIGRLRQAPRVYQSE